MKSLTVKIKSIVLTALLLALTGSLAQAQAPYGGTALYLRGSLVGSWDALEENVMTHISGSPTYTATVAVEGPNEFKIADSTWGIVNLGGPEDYLDPGFGISSITLTREDNPGNIFAELAAGTYTFTLDATDPEAPVLTVAEGGGGGTTDPMVPAPLADAEVVDPSADPASAQFFRAPWFGYFFADPANPGWIYSIDHAWVYVWPGQEIGAMWLWHTVLGQNLYLNATMPGYIYSPTLGWLYYPEQEVFTSSQRRFWSFNDSQWVEVDLSGS
jgi:hypothetical protein